MMPGVIIIIYFYNNNNLHVNVQLGERDIFTADIYC